MALYIEMSLQTIFAAEVTHLFFKYFSISRDTRYKGMVKFLEVSHLSILNMQNCFARIFSDVQLNTNDSLFIQEFDHWIITLLYFLYNLNQITNSKCNTRQEYNIKHEYTMEALLENKQGLPPVRGSTIRSWVQVPHCELAIWFILCFFYTIKKKIF